MLAVSGRTCLQQQSALLYAMYTFPNLANHDSDDDDVDEHLRVTHRYGGAVGAKGGGAMGLHVDEGGSSVSGSCAILSLRTFCWRSDGKLVGGSRYIVSLFEPTGERRPMVCHS